MHQLATATGAEPSLHCTMTSQYYVSTSERISLTNIAVGYSGAKDLVAPLDIDRRFWYVELSTERGAVAPSAIFTMTYNLSAIIILMIRQYARVLADRTYVKLGGSVDYHLRCAAKADSFVMWGDFSRL